VRKLISGVAALFLLVAGTASANEGVTPMLKMDTTYNIVFGTSFIPIAPFPGADAVTLWALTWEGTVEGDINGIIRWWVPFNTVTESFLGVGRWELWDCEPEYPVNCNYEDTTLLMMAGYDAFAYVSADDWEGKGIVTYANEQYAAWLGRRITDGGNVELYPNGFPCCGEGWFTIYDRPSNKH
jgi:hypothetical protein